VRKHEAYWPNQMRREPHQHLAFRQRFAYQTPLPLLQIAQAAVNQFAARHGSRAAEIAAFAQGDANAPAGGIAGQTHPVDSAADHQKIVFAVQRIHRFDRPRGMQRVSAAQLGLRSPPSREALAALTIASTCWRVISPCNTCMRRLMGQE